MSELNVNCFDVIVASSSFFPYDDAINDADRISSRFLIADLKRSLRIIDMRKRKTLSVIHRFVHVQLLAQLQLSFRYARKRNPHRPAVVVPAWRDSAPIWLDDLSARASMSLFVKHLLAAIARLLNPLACQVTLGTISGHCTIRVISVNLKGTIAKEKEEEEIDKAIFKRLSHNLKIYLLRCSFQIFVEFSVIVINVINSSVIIAPH